VRTANLRTQGIDRIVQNEQSVINFFARPFAAGL
jgi:hypothetical protein